MNCDAEAGLCRPTLLSQPSAESLGAGVPTLHYVGDPMCSWCWGLAPVTRALADACLQEGWRFRLVPGGLRPGGGDAWTPEFRAFLREEWTRVARATGQSFGMDLLARATFDYDTEPACRAVVAARGFLRGDDARSGLLEFFSAIQRKFYGDGADPKDPGFYRELCQVFTIDADAFLRALADPAAARATREEFRLARRLGCRGFPSFIGVAQGRVRDLGGGRIEIASVLAGMRDLARLTA